MALREFTASDGREWRVWDVTPETMHPATRTEDYLAPYMDGWLVFEAKDESAKCRLHPIPPGWIDADDAELERMLHRAETIRGERTSGPHGRTAIEEAEPGRRGVRGFDGSAQSRSFRFPDGRFWSVAEWSTSISAPEGGTRTVLRFSAGARSLDLTDWPQDWRSFSDSQLASLLVEGFPRAPKPNPTPYRRRAGDER
ncbi:MAG TPA: hypothetical protein VG432_11165 [Gemmatimonadaceae bacterium]|nr:hypothetical protein [Gemmatimonadaceae bacterium]